MTTKAPSCAQQCQTITNTYPVGSVAEANYWNFHQGVLNTVVATGMGIGTGYLTRNEKVGTAVSAGIGVYLAKFGPVFYPGDIVIETYTICTSDNDFGVRVTERNVQIVRASK